MKLLRGPIKAQLRTIEDPEGDWVVCTLVGDGSLAGDVEPYELFRIRRDMATTLGGADELASWAERGMADLFAKAGLRQPVIWVREKPQGGVA